jgi:phospholipase C
VKQSGYWDQTLIVVTYDEHGGRWDHVPPPLNNGVWGDGARVPAVVIGPFAKRGFIDHEEHDTLSILKTIERIFRVAPFTQNDARATSPESSLNDSER